MSALCFYSKPHNYLDIDSGEDTILASGGRGVSPFAEQLSTYFQALLYIPWQGILLKGVRLGILTIYVSVESLRELFHRKNIVNLIV